MTTSSARPRRRADAERNIARVVAAARELLSSDPNATTDEIAQAAGVGRMTLYGHFRTRADLVDAALVDALRAGEQILSTVDLTGDNAREVMTRLLASSWELVAESAALLTAAEHVLPEGRVRALHDPVIQRATDLVLRGQEEGVFRTDLSASWLVSVMQYILHGAGQEVRAGRLPVGEASETVLKTVQSVLTG